MNSQSKLEVRLKIVLFTSIILTAFFLEQDHACTEDVLHVYCAGTGEVIMMSLLDAELKGDPKVCATHYRPHDYRHEEL